MNGKVYLLGAGPGDAGLLTLKGKKVLENADVVVYDRLVGDGILELMPENAEKINVGKNSGNHPVPQEQINRILLEKALEGKTVVRLKGGDCFLFGRGGEELELLCSNGVDFEVIPGIPSPIAATAYAGIPVTHRDFCSSVHFITGHRKKNGLLELNYDALVKLEGTLVFLMSVASCGDIAEGLINAGMDRNMNAAVIENGTRPEQRKFVTTLEKLSETVHNEHVISPALIVVGRVCSLSDEFDWFDNLPLHNTKILVTSPRGSASKLSELLSAYGAGVTVMPSIKTQSLDFALPSASDYEVVVFTSAAGVEAVFANLAENSFDARWFCGTKIAAVGSECAKALAAHGLTADFVPSVFNGKVMGKELLESGVLSAGKRALLLRAERAAKDLPRILSEAGVAVEEIAVYETLCQPVENIHPNDYDWVTFTSASCVESFEESCKWCSVDFSKIRALCIGPATAERAKKLGMCVYMPEKATLVSMAEYLLEVTK